MVMHTCFFKYVKRNTDKDEIYGKILIDSYIYEADRKGSVASSMAYWILQKRGSKSEI
jgi:hypothetical protein